MPFMSGPLLRKIAEKRASIAERNGRIASLRADLSRAELEQAIAEAELNAYEDALTLVGPAAKQKRPPRAPAGDMKRPLKDIWLCVLKGMADRHPQTTSNDKIIEIAESGGFKLNRENLRSQMGQYNQRGIVERVTQGEYRLTDNGARLIGVDLNDETPADPAGAHFNMGEAGMPEGPSKAAPTGSIPVSSTQPQEPWGDLDDEIPF